MIDFKYGTQSIDNERPEIKIIRYLANQYLSGDESHVYITQHAYNRSAERNIPIISAISTIADKYFIEYQPRSDKSGRDDRTLFYEGHHTKNYTVNTVHDLNRNLIALISVAKMDTDSWDICDAYIQRKK